MFPEQAILGESKSRFKESQGLTWKNKSQYVFICIDNRPQLWKTTFNGNNALVGNHLVMGSLSREKQLWFCSQLFTSLTFRDPIGKDAAVTLRRVNSLVSSSDTSKTCHRMQGRASDLHHGSTSSANCSNHINTFQ